MGPLNLADGFDAADETVWRKTVEKALKGAPFERLRSKTRDGLVIEPLYPRHADSAGIDPARGATPWTISARVDHPVASEANELALADLEGGVGELALVGAGSPWAHGGGLALNSLADFDRVLDGVILDICRIRIDAGHEGRLFVASLIELARQRGLRPNQLTLSTGLDPLGYLATRGGIEMRWDVLGARVADAAWFVREQGTGGSWLTADGRPWHAAGATEAQELAATLAAVVAYWRLLTDHGLEADEALGRIELILVADQDQFATIAKLRAARVLMARLRSAAGLPAAPAHIHAETAWRMMTRRDAHVNMLRTTLAAFAAGVGGADSVLVLPYSQAVGLPDSFARRVARNSQSILLEESNLFRVSDPAAGSGYVETLTQALAEDAWARFQEIEAEGGLYQSLRSGRLALRISASATAQESAVAKRRIAITGTSEFPNIVEKPVTVLSAPEPLMLEGHAGLALPRADKGVLLAAISGALRQGATYADLALARGTLQETVPQLRRSRLAEPFEQLRDEADLYMAHHGQPPAVFVATLGRIADFTPRATWVRNLFEVAGFSAPVGAGYADTDELVAAFRASGASVACLAGADAAYAEFAAATAQALKAAGCTTLYLAGKPVDAEAEAGYRAAGIDAFVHVGIDVVAILRDAQRRAGVVADQTAEG